MKKLATQLLPLLFFLSVCSPAFGQLAKTSLDETEVITRLYESNEPRKVTDLKREAYNPWTVHRKVAQWGLAGSMAATMLGSLAMDDEYFATTVIPVAGPFITIARIENDPNAFYRPGGRSLLLASGITQTAFLAYLTVAWIGETSYEGRNQSNLSVVPTGGRGGTGLTVRYRF